jgi:RNA 3'-terminal phosphate cyclase (ATP)
METNMDKYTVIDGSQGEGGGQVLRTALSLAVLNGKNIEIINIRAARKKPGLLRQHLTCVLAAQQVCDAELEGAELGSSRIRFTPGKIKAGKYHFKIGTAGSTVLVCQTLLPILVMAKQRSEIILEGGTHNGMSPSLSFFEHSFLSVLKNMGIECDISVSSLGFYPAGGGKWQITIEPIQHLSAICLHESGYHWLNKFENCSITVLLSKLSKKVAQREVATVKKELNWSGVSEIQHVNTLSAGNSLQLSIHAPTHSSQFEVLGEPGLSAERVAQTAVESVKEFAQSQSAVEEYLADQLLLWLAICGSGSFTTMQPSLHTITNIAVIKQLLAVEIKVEQQSEKRWLISL